MKSKGYQVERLPLVKGRENLNVHHSRALTAQLKEEGHSTGRTLHKVRGEMTQSRYLAPSTKPFTLLRAAGRGPLWAHALLQLSSTPAVGGR
jgi:hypothetical protein